MIIDIHVHAAGLNPGIPGNRISPPFRRSRTFKRFMRRTGLADGDCVREDADDLIKRRLLGLLEKSTIDRAVFLALDAAYHDDGTRDDDGTVLATDNDYVADMTEGTNKALFGASIHPYRPDAVAELERLAARGAALVKWLPSAQNIRPDDARCLPFYDALARLGIPLLCHTGNEHTLKAFSNALNHPERLVPALERGVTVIAAHCGTRLFLHERCHLSAWRKLALKHERLYGDLSAFGVLTRARPLRRLLKSPRHQDRLVYGSDFPAQPLPLSCIGWISLREAWRIHCMRNPFDKSLALMRAMGTPAIVLERADHLLPQACFRRVPATPPRERTAT